MFLMQTSKTFTTPGGRKVATRAHKLYAVVRDDGAVATVTLRTDNLATAEGYREQYGDESWELDALPPDVLNATIEANLAPYIYDVAWQDGLTEENEARATLDEAAERWAEVAAFLAG